jgi:hypothetical protein
MDLLGDMGHVESCFSPFVDSVSVGAVCAKRTIGSEIISDALDGTPRWQGSSESSIRSVWRVLILTQDG